MLRTKSAPTWRLISPLMFVVLAFAMGAEAQSAPKGTWREGRALFHSPAVSTNGLACIHCHSDFDEKNDNDGLLRAAHSLADAASRQTYWGQELEDPDRYQDVAHAGVVCVQTFMRNPKKLTAQQLVDLQAYLRRINRRPILTPLVPVPGGDLTEEYAGFEGGDKILGRGLFYAACHSCHPNGKSGIAPVAIPRDRDPAFYARKVREGNGLGVVFSAINPNAYDPASGLVMPYFGLNRLSNKQLRDIIAYIKSLP
jgi:cytochrome c553